MNGVDDMNEWCTGYEWMVYGILMNGVEDINEWCRGYEWMV